MEVAKYMTYLKIMENAEQEECAIILMVSFWNFMKIVMLYEKKSCIRETPNLSSNTNYIRSAKRK